LISFGEYAAIEQHYPIDRNAAYGIVPYAAMTYIMTHAGHSLSD